MGLKTRRKAIGMSYLLSVEHRLRGEEFTTPLRKLSSQIATYRVIMSTSTVC
jgi:hypothetical protein